MDKVKYLAVSFMGLMAFIALASIIVALMGCAKNKEIILPQDVPAGTAVEVLEDGSFRYYSF